MSRRSLALGCLLALVFFVGVAEGQSHAVALEKGLTKKISSLSDRWWKARPPTRFMAWDPKQRSDLEIEARSLGAIPEGTMSEVFELLWGSAKKLGPKSSGSKTKITLDTPYGKAWCYLVGTGMNQALIIGLHGGGPGEGSADEAQATWQRKGCIGLFPQSIKLVDDAWNTVHGERFVLSLIEIAKAQYDVDPDRVYVAGFSMGASGSWYLAGRHPDLFAGAAPFSGVLMASPKSQLATKEEVRAIQHGLVPNVRNLAMWYTIGLDDPQCMPGTYLFIADLLENLRSTDPGGWQKIHFKSIPGLRHAMPPGEPEQGLTFLLGEKRDTFPVQLVWEYASDPYPEPDPDEPVKRLAKRRFYWLGCNDPHDRQIVRAMRTKNEFLLDCKNTASGTKGITIYLNASMIDVAADVVVKSGDQEIYRGKPRPDVWTVLESLDEKLDRSMLFDRRIEL